MLTTALSPLQDPVSLGQWPCPVQYSPSMRDLGTGLLPALVPLPSGDTHLTWLQLFGSCCLFQCPQMLSLPGASSHPELPTLATP